MVVRQDIPSGSMMMPEPTPSTGVTFMYASCISMTVLMFTTLGLKSGEQTGSFW
jgi:hypothetical protein